MLNHLIFLLFSLAPLTSFASTKFESKEDLIQYMESLPKLSGWDFRVLEGEIDGVYRTVLLAGETHVKGTKASRIGTEIIQRFHIIGLEGVNLRKYPLGRLMLPQFRFVQQTIPKLFSSRGVAKSSIYAAHDLSKDEKSTTRLIRLEKNHEPSIIEKSAFALVAGSFLTAEAVLAYGIMVQLPRRIWIKHKSGTLFTSTNKPTPKRKSTKESLISTGKFFAQVGIEIAVFHLLTKLALIDGRNKTMISETIKVFKEDPEAKLMANIVGLYHVDGMEKLLIKEHGFKRVY